jgi:hypothetical protein
MLGFIVGLYFGEDRRKRGEVKRTISFWDYLKREAVRPLMSESKKAVRLCKCGHGRDSHIHPNYKNKGVELGLCFYCDCCNFEKIKSGKGRRPIEKEI